MDEHPAPGTQHPTPNTVSLRRQEIRMASGDLCHAAVLATKIIWCESALYGVRS